MHLRGYVEVEVDAGDLQASGRGGVEVDSIDALRENSGDRDGTGSRECSLWKRAGNASLDLINGITDVCSFRVKSIIAKNNTDSSVCLEPNGLAEGSLQSDCHVLSTNGVRWGESQRRDLKDVASLATICIRNAIVNGERRSRNKGESKEEGRENKGAHYLSYSSSSGGVKDR